MPNPVVHFEIIGRDGEKLQDFYSRVFGWEIDSVEGYGLVNAEQAGGGIGGGITGGERSQVTFYISVDHPQAFLNRIESLGGRTVVPVTTIPGMVTFAQFADPEGNVVGLVASEAPQ
jgi:predicted enzyme related to lactoylglutathione lyase